MHDETLPDRGVEFGHLLRQFRVAAGLTQAGLAERAGLSMRGVSDLERGTRRAPYSHTVEKLSQALELAVVDRNRLMRASRPRGLRGPPASRGLPAPLTSFVGRSPDVEELARSLRRNRLTTLTGTGGIGKTRLALAVAARARAAYPDGVCVVELAALADPQMLLRAIATALGLRDESDPPFVHVLVAALEARHALLILDNCEHLLQSSATFVQAILSDCSHVDVLATSREPLGVVGEWLWSVPPLPTPSRDHGSAAELANVPSVQLFVERARAANATFSLSDANASAIADVCRKLDGIPLALELAAARTRILTVHEIAERLADRFTLLTNTNRSVESRHQTLRATVDWSFDLLAPGEQQLFRKLSVFVGGCTLEAVESCGVGADIHSDTVLNLLAALVDKSMVIMTERDGTARYGMLETLHQYARESLWSTGEERPQRQRHAEWCLSLAEQAAPHMQSDRQAEWLARLDPEQDNLRAALTWCESDACIDGTRIGLRLVDVLHELWFNRLQLAEGRQWTERMLALSATAPSVVRARALNWAAQFAMHQDDGAGAQGRALEALQESRRLRYRAGEGQALTTLGSLSQSRGEYMPAVLQLEEAVRVCREAGDGDATWRAINNLAEAHRFQGRLDGARALFEEALALAQRRGDGWGMAQAVRQLGLVAEASRNYGQAAQLLEESLTLWQAVGATRGKHWSLLELGRVVLAQGNLQEAQSLMAESLRVCREVWDRRGIARCLEGLSSLAAASGKPAQAARLFGAAEALRTAIGTPILPGEQQLYEGALSTASHELGLDHFARAIEQGRASPVERAIAEAEELLRSSNA